MEKIRNQTYQLNQLNEGDRFYFKTNQAKHVHEVQKVERHLNQPSEMSIVADGERFPDRYAGSQLFKEVIFLRNTNNFINDIT